MKPLVLSLSLLSLLAVARSADMPPRKEGLWSSHTVSIDQPGNKKTEGTVSVCRNHAYDDHTEEAAKKAMARCKQISRTSSGATISTESECTIGASIIHTKGTVTKVSDNEWHAETHTTYMPAMGGTAETTMTMDQKYVGACPAGVQPGDIVSAGGKKVSTWKH